MKFLVAYRSIGGKEFAPNCPWIDEIYIDPWHRATITHFTKEDYNIVEQQFNRWLLTTKEKKKQKCQKRIR